ncbi:hypothetical protein BST81_09455 [Leptolyngbya sp. 'hensonii']|nr:hypothetical protein BST81_09455 [Leptolyngbya sp. 'hensonii']
MAVALILLSPSGGKSQSSSIADRLPNLPPPQVHPLPASLAAWQDKDQSGGYFDQVTPVEVGYFIWSRFPVRVYVEPAGTDRPSQRWTSAVLQAVQDWQAYIPLQMVQQPEVADISFGRGGLPIRFSREAKHGPTGRVRSAETRFELYTRPDPSSGQPYLWHRAAIRIRPTQTEPYIRAAARHELGHALGIWGHSSNAADVMYFSQVRQPPPISARDMNTLKKVYEQPTSLGWPLPASTPELKK